MRKGIVILIVLLLIVFGGQSQTTKADTGNAIEYGFQVNCVSVAFPFKTAHLKADRSLYVLPLHGIGFQKQITRNKFWEIHLSWRKHKKLQLSNVDPISEGSYSEIAIQTGLRWQSGKSKLNFIYGGDLTAFGYQAKGASKKELATRKFYFQNEGLVMGISPTLGLLWNLNQKIKVLVESAATFGFQTEWGEKIPEGLFGHPVVIEHSSNSSFYKNVSPISKLAIQVQI